MAPSCTVCTIHKLQKGTVQCCIMKHEIIFKSIESWDEKIWKKNVNKIISINPPI